MQRRGKLHLQKFRRDVVSYTRQLTLVKESDITSILIYDTNTPETRMKL